MKDCSEPPEYMVRGTVDPEGPFAYSDCGVCWMHCEEMRYLMESNMRFNWPYFWSNVLAEHGFMPLQYNIRIEFLPYVERIETGISP